MDDKGKCDKLSKTDESSAPTATLPLEGLINALRKGFMTCTSAKPEYYVTINFRTLEEAQALHRALVEIKQIEPQERDAN